VKLCSQKPASDRHRDIYWRVSCIFQFISAVVHPWTLGGELIYSTKKDGEEVQTLVPSGAPAF
jgi:hypothetical protein